jgi:hypothetical protein
MKLDRMIRMGAGAALTLTLALGSVPASAGVDTGDGHAVAAGGLCSDTSVWVLKARVFERRIRLVYGVHSHVAGEVWRVRIGHNGHRIFADAVETDDAGNLVVHVRTKNLEGTDVFRARAVNLLTEEICAGGLAVG